MRLRSVLDGDRCVVASSMFDPATARIAESLGFELGVMGGSVASYAVLGAPDLILVTATELVEQARRVCRATTVPLLVDADHGYGNALNVMRTVEDLQAAGVAGVTIEDTLLPRPFASDGKPALTALAEGAARMRAAVRARGSGGMVVFGRTSAASVTDVDDAIDRLRAYEDAGVDALFVPGLKRLGDLERIADAVRLPLVVGGSGPDLFDVGRLSALGVRAWLWGHHPMAAAVQAMYETMKAIRDGASPKALTGLASESRLAEVLRAASYDESSAAFLGDADRRA